MPDLPRNLQGVTPLLALCRLAGLLPYSIRRPHGIVRSVPWMIYSVLAMIFQPCFMGLVYKFTSSIQEAWKLDHFVTILYFIDMSVILTFPLYFAFTTLINKSLELNEMVRHLLDLERRFNVPSPLITKKWFVILCMVVSLLYNMLLVYLEIVLEVKESKLVIFVLSSYKVIFFWMGCVVCHTFLAFVLFVSKQFQHINDRIWMLTQYLKEGFEMSPPATSPKNQIECVNRSLHSSVFQKVAIHLFQVDKRIFELRESLFLVQETCRVVDKLFHSVLGFAYSFIITCVVSSLHTIITCTTLGAAHYVGLVMQTFLCCTLGACMALTAGRAVAEGGGEPAARAASALWLAAHGRPQAELQAQMLLLQMRSRSVTFNVGGLFPLDLRFFVGLLGTILGYLVVAVQFSQVQQGTM